MRRNFSELAEKCRVRRAPLPDTTRGDRFGFFEFPTSGGMIYAMVVAGDVEDADGWDHVSVSLSDRTPTWDEMCFIKDQFFDDEETVAQFHPKKSEYVNRHPYCLHLWRRTKFEYMLPPRHFVG